MQITLTLNGIKVTEDVAADMLLIDFVRAHGCKSVKRGCETSNCGLCTVFLDEKPVLSCSVLAARASGHSITTLEGLQEEAAEFGGFIADQGAEQCGFCNPGFIMNALALFRENPYPREEEVKEYLSGNLCRCSITYPYELSGTMENWLRRNTNVVDYMYDEQVTCLFETENNDIETEIQNLTSGKCTAEYIKDVKREKDI